ncbi:MAG: hypothetical protein B7Y25_01150 [Alphaproteobacteria bacterium 16-39-46]|nr:MAG: hypothetical protein B7Y25_01150 [Alphaproteobacteria bacterium 16-39-46]OZA44152.1 MAG: hypothetical protein B7X84_01335 [Alphaproteobacteria bacterium 17-39-52]HQS83506.1 hypothetical protein [Alphaproteobacteria bacterium]HQS93274.1 hypothetical protein [Alphaproteobacteria bacterium]
MKKLLSLFALCLIIIACEGPPLPSHEMSPMLGIYSQLPVNPDFEQNIKLGNVQIAKNAEHKGAPVKVAQFTEALQQALLGANFAARSQMSPKYTLDAMLLDLDIPSFTFSMDVTAKARYQLKRADTNQVVLDEVIMLSSHVPYSIFSDANFRMRSAATKAIQENITHLIRLLASKPTTH